jgi:hypothetical protein
MAVFTTLAGCLARASFSSFFTCPLQAVIAVNKDTHNNCMVIFMVILIKY